MDDAELTNKAEHFLEELGRLVGLGELKFNEDSVCCIEAGERIQIQIEWAQSSHNLVFLALLGTCPERNREEFLRTLLEANFLFLGTAGETLCVEPDDHRVMLCRAVPLDVVPVSKALEWFNVFLGVADEWIDKLANGIPGGEAGLIAESEMPFNFRA